MTVSHIARGSAAAGEVTDFGSDPPQFRMLAALAKGDARAIETNAGGGEPWHISRALRRWRAGDPQADVMAALSDAIERPRRPAGAPWHALAPCLDETHGARLIAFTRHNPTDRPATLRGDAAMLEAGPEERCRLVIDALPSGQRFEVHLLVSLVGPAVGQPVVSLRLLHGNDPEEIVLTFRNAQLLLFGMVERSVEWSIGPRLISIAVDGAEAVVSLDGVPVWVAPRRRSGVPTGINLDVIGVRGGVTTIGLHWVRLGPIAGSASIGPAIDTHARGLVERHFERHLLDVDAVELAPELEAFRSLPLPAASIEPALRTLARIERGYPAHVIEGLARRLEPSSSRDPVLGQEPVVEVEGVSVDLAANASLKSFSDLFARRKKAALSILSDVSFEAYRGDIIGIIGKNGAGKSTLLRAIIGAVPISKGRIGVRGHPVLLRPGAGMHPELTGRENIMQAGLYMGLTPRGVREIVDDIIEFSELGSHIDRPYQYYSDGMRARLVFSLATSISPEILMLDELLGAGDIGFQEKAARRLDTFIRNAHVVFVVQHGMDFVMTRCTKCLYLAGGRQAYFGDPRIAAELYQSDL